MQFIQDFINQHFSLFDIPGMVVFWIVIVLIITLLFKRIFSLWVLRYIRKLTAKTETTLDDELLEILNPPLSYIILLFGIWIIRNIANDYMAAQVKVVIDEKFFPFAIVILVCWLIYRSARVFSSFLETASKRTETELDDLIAPYLAKVIKIVAIVMVFVKASEILFGISAGALFGLLGGMGLTLGLVFKDLVANWFGCAIIYLDNLFREGDWVQLNDGSVVDADVEAIGLRSTIFRNFDKTVSIVPNAALANGVVKNWSRMHKRRVKLHFRVDGISSELLQNVLDGIRNILATDEEVHQEFHMVNFREVEGNGRVIRLYYFTKTLNWKEHEQIRENINLKVLQLFEHNKIDDLAYTIVDMSDDRPADYHVSSADEPKA